MPISTLTLPLRKTAMKLLPLPPSQSRAVVIGAGTMGPDVAAVLARAGCRVTVVDPHEDKRMALRARVERALQASGRGAMADRVVAAATLEEIDWIGIDLVIECISERLADKQDLFRRLVDLAPANAVLASNSSSFPIGAIAGRFASAARMYGLHFFMPAHIVPLVEVVLGPQSDKDQAQNLCAFMKRCGSVPVLVRKDKPGFLANRLQHALAREAFALIDEGVATPEDIDAAVRFGFGFRFLAAGPVLQRDHAGIDVHCAAAATMYPSLSDAKVPAFALRDRVDQGRLGMKTGAGFYDWTPEQIAQERDRYDRLLQRGLELLADELPVLSPAEGPPID
jgi:3-hydroxybutyryl-CoA dehydrogenase